MRRNQDCHVPHVTISSARRISLSLGRLLDYCSRLFLRANVRTLTEIVAANRDHQHVLHERSRLGVLVGIGPSTTLPSRARWTTELERAEDVNKVCWAHETTDTRHVTYSDG